MTWELQFCGDEWRSVSGLEASEVRLWEAAYWVDGNPSQGTYITGDEPVAVVFNDGTGYISQDGGDVYRTWADAMSHAVMFHPEARSVKRWLEAW